MIGGWTLWYHITAASLPSPKPNFPRFNLQTFRISQPGAGIAKQCLYNHIGDRHKCTKLDGNNTVGPELWLQGFAGADSLPILECQQVFLCFLTAMSPVSCISSGFSFSSGTCGFPALPRSRKKLYVISVSCGALFCKERQRTVLLCNSPIVVAAICQSNPEQHFTGEKVTVPPLVGQGLSTHCRSQRWDRLIPWDLR